jgi:uncharacterized phage-associated protein
MADLTAMIRNWFMERFRQVGGTRAPREMQPMNRNVTSDARLTATLCRIVTLMSWRQQDSGRGGDLLVGTKPIDAARWLIAVAQDAGRPLTNFKIQKLLYYAHGDYLSQHSKPLFKVGFEAWEHGPVCPPAYRAFSEYGSEPIANMNVDRQRLATKIADAELAVLEQAWADYGDWSVPELWDDVHRPESPWERVYVPGQDHIEISDEAIANYFTDLQSPKIRRSMNRLRKRRDERGEPGRELVGDAGILPELDAWDDLRSASSIGLLG